MRRRNAAELMSVRTGTTYVIVTDLIIKIE